MIINKGIKPAAVKEIFKMNFFAISVYSSSSSFGGVFMLKIPKTRNAPVITREINNKSTNLISTTVVNKYPIPAAVCEDSINIELVSAATNNHKEKNKLIEPNNPE